MIVCNSSKTFTKHLVGYQRWNWRSHFLKGICVRISRGKREEKLNTVSSDLHRTHTSWLICRFLWPSNSLSISFSGVYIVTWVWRADIYIHYTPHDEHRETVNVVRKLQQQNKDCITFCGIGDIGEATCKLTTPPPLFCNVIIMLGAYLSLNSTTRRL